MNFKEVFCAVFVNFLVGMETGNSFSIFPDSNNLFLQESSPWANQGGQGGQGGYTQSQGQGGYSQNQGGYSQNQGGRGGYLPPQNQEKQEGYSYPVPNNPLVYPEDNLSNSNRNDQDSSESLSNRRGRNNEFEKNKNERNGQRGQSQNQLQSSAGQRGRGSSSPRGNNNLNGGNGRNKGNGGGQRQTTTTTTSTTPTSSLFPNEEDEQNNFTEDPSQGGNQNEENIDNLGLVTPEQVLNNQGNPNLIGFPGEFERHRELEGQVFENEVIGGRLSFLDGIGGDGAIGSRLLAGPEASELLQNEEGASTNLRTLGLFNNFHGIGIPPGHGRIGATVKILNIPQIRSSLLPVAEQRVPKKNNLKAVARPNYPTLVQDQNGRILLLMTPAILSPRGIPQQLKIAHLR